MGASPIPVVAAVSGPTSFRVSSFNILGYDHTAPGGTKKGYADGALRMKWAVQLIKSRQVDVVGLQEFQPQQYAKWVKKASAQYDIFPGYIDTHRLPAQLDRLAQGQVPPGRRRRGSSCPTSTATCSACRVVLLQSLQTGQQIYFMNFQNPADVRGNALKWRLLGQRLQIALVNQLKTSNGLPIVWTGDMNAKKQVFCRVTKQAGMVSASGGFRSDATCQPPRGMVVDWIFGSKVQFSNYVQDRSRKVVRTTDHHMLRHRRAGPAGRADRSRRPADPDAAAHGPTAPTTTRHARRRAPRSRPATP